LNTLYVNHIAEVPCEQDTLELKFVFISRLLGIMQTLISGKSECISRWSSDSCVELIQEKQQLNTYGMADILMAKT